MVGMRPEDISIVKETEAYSIPGEAGLIEPIGSTLLSMLKFQTEYSVKFEFPNRLKFGKVST